MFFLGRISKRRGNRGEVIFHVSPEIDINSIDFSGTFELRSKKHNKKTRMESYSLQGSSVVAKFNISNTIDDALRLVGYDVYSTQLRDTGSPLDLDGYSVFDKAGDCWGTVIGLSLSGPLRILEVQSEDGVIMVPFEDAIVVEVDEKERKILLDPPEGLRDLN